MRSLLFLTAATVAAASTTVVAQVPNPVCSDNDPAGRCAAMREVTGAPAMVASLICGEGDNSPRCQILRIDSDGDLVLDMFDNCPNTANNAQTDTDGDDIGDACDPHDNRDADGDSVQNYADNCPGVANANQNDLDGDGQGDACDSQDDRDSDNDSVANYQDNCPNDANPDQADLDSDGYGDACDSQDDRDTDADNIANYQDNCPNHTNGDQADTDGDGYGDVCDPFYLAGSDVLLGDSGQTRSRFGASLAAHGNILAVGEPEFNDPSASGQHHGQVELFMRDGDGWISLDTINPLYDVPNASYPDNFGSSVALSDNFLAVGGPKYRQAGAVAIYKRDDSGSHPTWSYVGFLEPFQETSAGDVKHFGGSLSLIGNQLFVGAMSANYYENDQSLVSDVGSVYVYELAPDGAASIPVVISPDDPAAAINSRFGFALEASASTLVVGAPGHRDGSGSTAAYGAMFRFDRVDGQWVQRARVLGNQPHAKLGTSVALDCEIMYGGAPRHALARGAEGVVYIAKPDGSGGMDVSLLVAPIQPEEREEHFGQAIAAGSGVLAVGSPGTHVNGVDNAGSLRIFEWTTNGMAQIGEHTLGAPHDIANGKLGGSLALSGKTLASGATGYRADENAGESHLPGRVLVFDVAPDYAP